MPHHAVPSPRTRRRLALLPALTGAAVCFLLLPGAAQSPAPAPGRDDAAASAPAPYSYRADGRRDPFVSLVNRGVDTRSAAAPGEGLRGLAVNDLALRGLLQSRGGYVALVLAPDTKTYLVRPNDRLLDGTIKAVTAQGLVIVQDVHDPLSLAKQREIHKGLPGSDEGK